MTALCSAALLSACGQKQSTENPFFTDWDTPFGVPPFEKIMPEHYVPAYEEGMAREKAEIEAIVSNPDAPTFENTVLAYDNTGEFLRKVSTTFGCVTGTDMTPELEEIQVNMSPVLTGHRSDISLNPVLFERIKAVYEGRDSLCADDMQRRLTEKIYKGFERSGANLPDDQKAELRKLDEELSKLSIRFGRNLRSENGAFELLITDEADLGGLPVSVIATAAEEAENRGKEGWVFTLDKPSMIPFLQYAENRELREKLYKGYLERCNNDNAFDNKSVVDSIANLRLQRAQLMGYPNHAAYVLDRQMAKQPEAVYAMLNDIWTPAMIRARQELGEMSAIKVKSGDNSPFASWDWWFYAEKLRQEKYDLNEDELRPYFSLDNTREGIFTLSNKLFGITFREITDIPKYNTANQVFEVTDKDGTHLGIVYFDFHPRAGKRVGAWCTSFRGQSYTPDGERVAPVVSIVCNFSKPTGDTPALLTLDEVETFFHEFGHGLHTLFAKVPYKGLRGVERDFVELPSQIMENWAFEPELMALYAKHYQTGEVIPEALAEKIENSSLFNQGFATVENLAACFLDMDYHTINKSEKIDVPAFERESMTRIGAMPEIEPRYRSTYFQHIFSGGYASGYYSYMWAEVLDADAFEAFVETGDIFNTEVAEKFRDEVLSKGSMADGDQLYRNFRSHEPSKEPFLKRRGLNNLTDPRENRLNIILL